MIFEKKYLTLFMPKRSNRQWHRRKRKARRFRLQARRLFLTFPTCGRSTSYVLKKIQSYFIGKLTWCIVAREEHSSTGEMHIHALIVLDRPCDIKDPRALDYLTGQHGKYETVRNLRQTVDYILKDGDYLVHGIDIDILRAQLKAKQTTKSAHIATMVSTGHKLTEVDSLYPGFYMMHMKCILGYKVYKDLLAIRKGKIGKKELLEKLASYQGAMDYGDSEYLIAEPELTLADGDILNWLIGVLSQDPLPPSSKGLYLYGGTALGKSTLIQNLDKYLSIYYFPTEHFHDKWQDGSYDMIVFDEANPCHTITSLNKWLDGQPMSVRKKGSQGMKTENVPFVIISNGDLDEMYPNAYSVRKQALARRLTMIEVTEKIQLFWKPFWEFPDISEDLRSEEDSSSDESAHGGLHKPALSRIILESESTVSDAQVEEAIEGLKNLPHFFKNKL